MRNFLKATITAATLTLLSGNPAAAQAGQLPNSTPQSSYLSVMSKAGTPTPRPQVPNRTVGLPAGAGAGYDYYYGYRYRGGGGAPSPSYAEQPAPSTSTTLPGYDTRPGRSKSAGTLSQEPIATAALVP